MYRSAEGTGTTARFDNIKDIDFLSSTELICTDYSNHCLRLVDFSRSPPQTSAYAGSCTVSGKAEGHRLNSAQLEYPEFTEVNKDQSSLFVLVYRKTLHMIDLKTDNLSTLKAFDKVCLDMILTDDHLLYFLRQHLVAVFNPRTREEQVVAGSNSIGRAVGPFEDTRFNKPLRFVPWSDEVNTLLLIADHSNNRFAGLPA